MGLAYLIVGGTIVCAYGLATGPGLIAVEWDGAVAHAPWLLPGIALMVATPQLRRRHWAAAVATGVFGSTAAAGVPFVVWRLAVDPTWPQRAALEAAIFAMWFAALAWGLRQLRRQLQWIRATPTGGFPVLFPSSTSA